MIKKHANLEALYLQNFDEILKSVALDLLLHNLHHLLADELLVGCLGIAGSLDLLLGLLCKSNAEHSEDVTILGFGLDKSLNEGVPFLDHSSTMVPGDVHAIEISIAVKALNLLNLESKLLPGSVLGIFIAVTEAEIEDTTLEGIGRVEKTSSLVDGSKGNASLLKARG